ncbi:isochorismatase family protein [Rhodoferax sp.]|uniref:cysteine hydrolase family protein n=1 Tax=Rhodoferax sp. TaxID=50421 RepID=UPI0025DB8D00|nr:isochorismatase family protein [Rhodoferax sp.]MCM2296741.1 isochorismatase family protein [Rhodoferax sp.]
MKKALIVIDIQNDYFPGGAFTLENANEACKGAVEAIEQAKRDGWLVVGVQHVNSADAPAFKPDTEGVKIHNTIAAALGDAPIVVKSEADSFFKTNLVQIVRDASITDLYLTGMMTQHCVTHTALSPQASDMKVHIIAKGCAAPAKALSDLALQGLSARCDVV